MQYRNSILLVGLFFVFATMTAQKYQNKSEVEVKTEWNGATFLSSKTFEENINELDSFSILNTIMEDKNLIETLSTVEMVTIFAPLDTSFESLKKEDRKNLLADKNRISNTIKYLAVPGRVDLVSMEKAVANGRTMQLMTLNGEKLGVKLVNGKVVLFDAKNNSAEITASNFYHKNGLFHVINGLVYPTSAK